ncbi:MAG: SOS response-associated peptidase [Opitutales bacterium]|nr:SOS response-associated peptidase [Opitutales bacterium]MCH8539680.1 SOS response-associated peptidase [Opitutales bacterium]
MCGRFTLRLPASFASLPWLSPEALKTMAPRFNIGPGQEILYWSKPSDPDQPAPAQNNLWGWSSPKKEASGSLLINARLESLTEKPTFRPALDNPILIPADGYYEWEREGGAPKPFFHHLPNDEIFFLAGLEKDGKALALTTTAIAPADQIHHRMPVLLNPEEGREWLFQTTLSPRAYPPPWLSKPSLASRLHLRPAHPRVNNIRHDAPDCLAPPPPEYRQQSLF